MKRSGIFALATACAMGVTALVGGIGYASALDVAEQAGRSIDVKGVSTVDGGSEKLAGSPKLDPTAEPAAEDATAEDAPVASDEVADPVVDDGTADQGSGDAVVEVAPSDPVVIDHKGKKSDAVDKRCGSLKKERAAWFAAQQGADPGESVAGTRRSGEDGAKHEAWSKDGRTWSKDWSKSWDGKRIGDRRAGDGKAPADEPGDKTRGDTKRGDKDGSDTSWERSSDDRGGDRHGDHRSGKGGTHGHPGGGKHGGGGWGGGRR